MPCDSAMRRIHLSDLIVTAGAPVPSNAAACLRRSPPAAGRDARGGNREAAGC